MRAFWIIVLMSLGVQQKGLTETLIKTYCDFSDIGLNLLIEKAGSSYSSEIGSNLLIEKAGSFVSHSLCEDLNYIISNESFKFISNSENEPISLPIKEDNSIVFTVDSSSSMILFLDWRKKVLSVYEILSSQKINTDYISVNIKRISSFYNPDNTLNWICAFVKDYQDNGLENTAIFFNGELQVSDDPHMPFPFPPMRKAEEAGLEVSDDDDPHMPFPFPPMRKSEEAGLEVSDDDDPHMPFPFPPMLKVEDAGLEEVSDDPHMPFPFPPMRKSEEAGLEVSDDDDPHMPFPFPPMLKSEETELNPSDIQSFTSSSLENKTTLKASYSPLPLNLKNP